MHVNNKINLSEQASRLVAGMNKEGYALIEDYITPGELAKMKRFVCEATAAAGGAYVGFTGPEQVVGSGLEQLAKSAEFRALVERVYAIGTGRDPVADPFYQVLRCIQGNSFAQHSLLFHYDSYIVTVLCPIEIPTSGKTGDLIMLPNTRRIRSRYLLNVMDKILLDNPLTQLLLRTLLQRGWLKATRLKLKPGNIYFFWGYRSVHTNEACDTSAVRATALFHYANPHADSRRPFPGVTNPGPLAAPRQAALPH